MHRLKKWLTNFSINLLMFFILFLTLFPILWMIYASFKRNTDILSGRMGPTRIENDIVYLAMENNYLYTCTSVGNITKYDKTTHAELLRHDLGTGATYYTFDKDYIWISSSNRGLLKFKKENLELAKSYPLPVKDIDVSKVGATVQYRFQNKIWIGMQWENSPGLIEFDIPSETFTRTFSLDLLPMRRQIIDISKTGKDLVIATNTTVLKLDPESGKVIKFYPWIVSGVTGTISKLLCYGNKVYVGTTAGLYEVNLSSEKINKLYPAGETLEQVYVLTAEGNLLYLGTNTGLTILDLKTKEIRSFSTLFSPLRRLKQEELTQAGVLSLAKVNNLFYLGSSDGRMSVFDPRTQIVKETFFIREARWAIESRNYVDMWKNINFGLFLRNSFIICGITMLIAMVLATMSAYALSRFPFPGSRLMGNSVLATQMVPGIMFLIPLYLMFIKFTELTGIPVKGTFGGLIFLYSAFFVPFSIWILRGFFASIPVELEEAARIDGCSPFQVFWRIALPLALPGIIATGIYVFLTAWDELLFAWVLTSGDTMTLPVGIRLFVGNYQNRFDLLMAASTVATIPVMILFLMLQRHIVHGLTAGAVKG